MINFNFMEGSKDIEKLNKGVAEELEKASLNLPSEISITVYYIYEKSDYLRIHLSAIPYTSNKEADLKDICYLLNFQTNGILVSDGSFNEFTWAATLTDNAVFNFDELPEKYDFINLYIIDSKTRKENHVKTISMSFFNNKKKDLFSYHFDNETEYDDCFLGTLAKTSSGWKFYPRFEMGNNFISNLTSTLNINRNS